MNVKTGMSVSSVAGEVGHRLTVHAKNPYRQ